jgi:hypothetical protein
MSDAAIADYTTLVSEVKVWCARTTDSTFSNRFPVFVTMAENRIYNGHGQPGDDLYSAPLRTSVMETTATVTLTDGEGTLPADFLEARSIFRDGDPIGMLYAPPDKWDVMNVSAISGSPPYYYTTKGDTLLVTPAYTGDVTLSYFKRFDAVSASNPSGALIAEHGAVYFACVMLYAFAFMRDQENAGVWLNEYRAIVDGLNRTSHAKRRGAQSMRMIARAIG